MKAMHFVVVLVMMAGTAMAQDYESRWSQRSNLKGQSHNGSSNRKVFIQEKAKELGVDMSTADGRAKFKEHMQQNGYVGGKPDGVGGGRPSNLGHGRPSNSAEIQQAAQAQGYNMSNTNDRRAYWQQRSGK